MADSVDTAERQTCWITMSDLFVDNEVDYRYVAEQLTRHCPNMTLSMLKAAFFDEVAPELASNGMTPVPSVWLEFDSDDVVAGISKMLARRRASLLYRVGNSAWRFVCRWFCREIWEKLERELIAVRSPSIDD